MFHKKGYSRTEANLVEAVGQTNNQLFTAGRGGWGAGLHYIQVGVRSERGHGIKGEKLTN